MTLNRATLKRTVLTIVIALTILAMGAQAMAENAYILGATRVYVAADVTAASIKVPAGVQVELVSTSDGWAKIEKNGITAYISADYVAAMQTYNGETYYVKNATALYKSFGSSKKYGTMSVGTQVSLYAVLEDWAMVSIRGIKGFVRINDLSSTAVAAESAPADSGVVTGRATVYVCKEGAKVYKSYSTSSAVLGKLPVNVAITLTAVAGDWCRVENSGYVAYMKKDDLSAQKVSGVPTPSMPDSDDSADTAPGISTSVPSGASAAKSSAKPATGIAKEMDWWTSDIQSIFARGVTVTVTDVATGIAWKETRYGGTNHADVQPCTAADTAAMKAACGSWSWERRAIFVTVNGVNYAASMNCMPHGSGSVSGNNFDGHHCIHFTNSRTHGSNKVCSLHQAAIKKAASTML